LPEVQPAILLFAAPRFQAYSKRIHGEPALKFKPWQWIVLVSCIGVFAVTLYRSHQVTEGRKAFERLGCPTCHMAGGAPSLEFVGRKYDRATFVEWVSNPETVYARLGRKPLNRGYEPMPRLEASHRDIEVISWFLSAQR
jgi:hypothetical protein